nr:diguanylate cyclase [Solibacillus silvestris]
MYSTSWKLQKQVAAALNKFVGKHDLVARWGGDEFVVSLTI